MPILPPFVEQEDDEEKENKKNKGNLRVDLSKSQYFSKHLKAIANPQERSVKLFKDSLEGLPEGWKMRTLVVNKEKGTTQDHYLSPDGYVLKTGRGVLEYLWLEGKLSQEAIVNIGKNVLHVSDKKINGFLNNLIEEVDLTTFDDVDEDEEVQVKEETDLASDQDEAAKEEDEEKGDEINLGLTFYT